MSQQSIGLRLKQLREQFGLPQHKFGEMIGIDDRSTISKYENGSMPISKKAEFHIISTLGVNREWLLSGKGAVFSDESKFRLALRAMKSKDLTMGHLETNVKVELYPYIIASDQQVFLKNLNDSEYIADISSFPFVVPNKAGGLFKPGNNFVFEVNSWDLYNGEAGSICKGDTVVASQKSSFDAVTLKRDIIDFEVFGGGILCVVATKEELYFKILEDSDVEQNTIRLRSSVSDSFLYRDIILNIEDIQALYLIQTVIHNYSIGDSKSHFDYMKSRDDASLKMYGK